MPSTNESEDEPAGSDGNEPTDGDDGSRRWSARTVGFSLALLATIGMYVVTTGEDVVFPFTPHPALADLLAPHRFHDLVFALLLVVVLLGLVIQLYRPATKLVGLLGSLVVVWIASAIYWFVGSPYTVEVVVLGVLGLVTLALHPAVATVRRPHLPDRVDPIVAGLVVVAAVPLLVYAADQLVLQYTGDPADLHVVGGHYANMATLAASIVVLGVIAVLAPVGWRIAAVGAGSLALAWGVASIVYPALESSGGVLWGSLAIGWAVAFVAAVEYAHRVEAPADVTDGEPARPALGR